MKKYLEEKQEEFIWHLENQSYSQADIAELFNVSPVKITRVMKRKQKDWKPRWIKTR